MNSTLGKPTIAAERLKWLDENGHVEFKVYRGARDETFPLDERGRRDMSRAKYGIISLSEIVFDPYASDALSGLAHEIDHAYLLARGEQQSGHFGEFDPVRVENEIRHFYLDLKPLEVHGGTGITNPTLYINGGR